MGNIVGRAEPAAEPAAATDAGGSTSSSATTQEEEQSGVVLPVRESLPSPRFGDHITVLSIDGGGIRGLIPAVVLKTLEEKLQLAEEKLHRGEKNVRIADYFDVVAGTSTGALITAMLVTPGKNKRPKYTPEEIKNFYVENGSKIFPPKRWWWKGPLSLIRTFWGAKYDGTFLQDEIKRKEATNRAATGRGQTGWSLSSSPHTMEPVYTAKGCAKWGALGWAHNWLNGHSPIIDIFANASAVLVDWHVAMLLHNGKPKKEQNYLRIQAQLEKDMPMDDATPENIQTLVEVGDGLMAKKVHRVGLVTGRYEEDKNAPTNDEELGRLAMLLVQERKKRIDAKAEADAAATEAQAEAARRIARQRAGEADTPAEVAAAEAAAAAEAEAEAQAQARRKELEELFLPIDHDTEQIC